MNAFAVGLLIVIFIFALSVPVAGAVISHRAWKRNGWPEARLAFRSFAAWPALHIVAAIVYPISAWLKLGNSVIDDFALLGLIFVILNGLILIVIAIAMYRLARRSDRRLIPPSSQQTSEIPLTLS